MSQQLSTSRRKFLKGSVATIGGAAIARSFGAFGNRFIGQPLGHAQAQAGTYPANKMSAALPDVNNTIALTTPHIIKEIAPGLAYEVWAFNESGPGPHLHVKQGETVHFSMTNTSDVIHSIDFHAAQVPWSQYYQAVNPGDTLEFDWTPNIPGTFMYHCGTPPVLHHIGNGMHGAIIVQPTDGWQEPAREYVIVQHEFYLGDPDEEGVFRGNTMKMKSAQPDLVLFNGYMNQYVESPLEADPGELIRIHVVNCGPTTFSAFHVIGALFEASYASGHPANKQTGMQTVTVPPGGGYTVELRIPDEGLYPFVTHSFAYTELGAVGMLKIGDPA
jgi:nitrite reductase (NO-forming)